MARRGPPRRPGTVGRRLPTARSSSRSRARPIRHAPRSLGPKRCWAVDLPARPAARARPGRRARSSSADRSSCSPFRERYAITPVGVVPRGRRRRTPGNDRISRVIGEAHPRLGGDRFVTGAGRFVEDVWVDGMLHAAVLRSPHAHARLVSIDTKAARDLPGVHAVLTRADVPAAAVIPNRVPAPKGAERYLQPAIAREVVRYVGEPVALVVADDPYIARDALDRIDVVYQPLAACASTTEALAAGAARLFQSTDSNNVATITMRVGDADQALAGAHLRLRERFTYP